MDRIAKFLAYEGRVSLICANTTQLIEEIRKLHDLTPTTTAVLGRFSTISGMMGFTEIKEKDDFLSIQLNGKGPVGTLVSIVRREEETSKIKVSIDNPYVELPLKSNGKLDVGGAVGTNGFLNIINKNEITDSNYTGLVPLVSGEIAEDFTEYFAKSKQKPTVVALGVLVNKDEVKASGGYMIQLMPDATEEDIVNIEKALEKAPAISEMIDKNKSLEEIAKIVTGDENVLILAQELSLKYECDCTRERFERGCHFCNKKYHFSKEDLEKLLKEIK